ncbi:MAG: ATP-binding cassette domain-containing protein [Syntrophaceae bacterium]|nr:ATP-binding cassette domain-containing protein [Syntrophaceae bacterium]
MIEINNLSLKLGDFAIKDVNMSVEDGEYFVILGPTGAGKTVIVECVAGLQRFKKGEIWIAGKNVTNMAPEDRDIGYVPQDYALFPFLNVVENITFGLKEKRCSEKNMRETVGKLSELLGISHLLNRGVTNLSGGRSSGWHWPGLWQHLQGFCSLMNHSVISISARQSICVSSCGGCMRSWA